MNATESSNVHRLTKRLLSVPEAADYLGIGRSKLYKLIGSGDMPTVAIGHRTLLDLDELDAYVEGLKAAR